MGSVRFLNEGWKVSLDDYKQLIGNAAALGAKWLLDCGTSNEAHYRDYYELMRRAAPYADQAGINIALKPHGGISLTIQDLIKADQEVNHSAFGICYDPGNIIYYTKGELRPETEIDAVAPKGHHINCKGLRCSGRTARRYGDSRRRVSRFQARCGWACSRRI